MRNQRENELNILRKIVKYRMIPNRTMNLNQRLNHHQILQRIRSGSLETQT